MFSENLILSIIVISLGFVIFLLSNLQRNILIKIFGWLVSSVVIFFGGSFLAKNVWQNLFAGVNKSKIGESAGQKIYKKAELNKIFDEVNKAWKDK